MKLKYLIPAIAIILLSSFAAVDILSEVKLSKEQLSDRLLKELEAETPGSFLDVAMNTTPTFGLDVSFSQFKGIGGANYRTDLMQMKAEIMQAIASQYFQQQWEAWLKTQGLLKATTIHELAADNVGNTFSASIDETQTKDNMVEDVNNIISSCNDDITDAGNKLKEPGNPPGRIKVIQADKQKAVSKLAAIKEVQAKEGAGDDAFKAAYLIYKHTEDVFDELDNVNTQLNAIAEDMKLWSAGVGADHKRETLADKQRYEGQKALYQQVLDKKKISDAAFNKAYVNFQREKQVQEEMARLKDEDVKFRIDKRNPYLRLQPILQQFLTLTDGMDFKAALKDLGKYKIFVNPDFEAKSTTWKFYFRRGEAFTGAARDIAKQWMGELR